MRPVLLVLLVTASAAAQSVATEPHPHAAHPPSGLGAELTFGFGGQVGGPAGYVARFEYEVLPVLAPTHVRGGVGGFHGGFEYWRSGTDNAGFALPVVIVGGMRVFPVRALLGIGFDAFLVDQVADDTGVGWLAPIGMAHLALDIHGFQLGVDTRVDYRWQFGAPDHARWQLGLVIGRTYESRAPIY